MDDIISQLRRTQNAPMNEHEDRDDVKENTDREQQPGVNDCVDMEDAGEDNESERNQEVISFTDKAHYNDIHDITSSQDNTLFRTAKFDFDTLKQMKAESKIETDIDSVKKCKQYRVSGYLVAIIRNLNKFSEDVIHVELVDESGTINGSCPVGIIEEHEIRIGSIVVLSNCSLWKIFDNHLNITAVNIKDVINM